MKEKLQLKDIPRVKTISSEEFGEEYSKPQNPVVIEQLIEDWWIKA